MLDTKIIATSTIAYTLPPGIYETSDFDLMLKSLLPYDVKVKLTLDHIGLRSNLNTNETKKLMKQKKSEKPNNIRAVDLIHSKRDCNSGTIANGVREPVLYSFAFDKPPGHEFHKTPGIKLFKKINRSVWSQAKFYSEDDDHKPVDLNEETMSFTC